jgi:tetratricopeptide (TPR) repeat protein
LPSEDPDKLPPLAALEAAVQRSPADVDAWRNLASGYAALHMFDLAVQMLSHAVRLAPRDPGLRAQLGNALIGACNPREALAQMQEARRLDPRNATARTLDLGAAHAAAGEHEAAARLFREVLKVDPGMRAAWIRLAWALHAARDFAEAIPAFERAAAFQPDSVELWSALGDACARTGDDAKAARSYQLSLRLDPAQPGVWLCLGACFVTLHRLDDAEAACSEARRLIPRSTAPHRALGHLALRRKRPREAVEHFRRAVCLRPHDASLWHGLCEAHDQNGSARAASEAARQRARLDPTSVAAHLDLGLYCRQAGRHDEAARSLVRAVQLAPDNRVALDELRDQISLLNDTLDFEAAREVLEALVTLAPGDAPAWRQLGWIYCLFLRHADAISALRRALDLVPGDPEAWHILARVLELENDGPALVQAFDRLVTVAPAQAQDFYASHIEGKPWANVPIRRAVPPTFCDPVTFGP